MARFTGILITETDKARLFKVVDRQVWIPKSVITSITKLGYPNAQGHRECIVDVLEWFAEKNEL
jgi:hypothetical protein